MKTVLIVEDEESLRMAYEFILSSKGYTVLVAENGQEALEKLHEGPIDIVLLDLFMPVMDGKQFMEQAHTERDYPDMKIIMCSNVSDSTTIAAMEALGIHRHILKANIMPDDLADIIADTLVV